MRSWIQSFGEYHNQAYDEIFVENNQGVRLSFSNIGARINRWSLPFEDGQRRNIILGHQTALEAIDTRSYYGATVGRVAGRINQGHFNIDNQAYQLEQNQFPNHLHGGTEGLDISFFDYEIQESEDEIAIQFSLMDPDGHNGYPGNLSLSVTHSFNESNEWIISYETISDQATLFNPTNHVYFNLNGDNRRDIFNHQVQVAADHYLPLNEHSIPLGHFESVEGTPFDMRQGVELAKVHDSNHPQYQLTHGFDHPFRLIPDSLIKAHIINPETQLMIEMETTEPYVIIYTHNHSSEPQQSWGHPLVAYSGITLETQDAPDAINQPELGNTTLRPGEIYRSQTTYRLIMLPRHD